MNVDDCVAFVGPIPPPIHGLAVINEAMLNEIRRHMAVEVFNRAPSVDALNRRESASRAALRTPALLLRFLRFLIIRRPRALYMSFSGGWGLLLDLPFAALGILSGTRVFVHHHSFSYLNRPTWYSRIALWLLQESSHVVLCDRMRQLLRARYAISDSRIVTLSNAAFLSISSKPQELASPTEFVIGFLSNITEAKGIFTYLRLAQRLQDSGAPVVTLIGGPIAKDIEARFTAALKTLPNAQYLGPLYGKEKDEFFSRLDVFVFPSTYENEAEPIVVLEAMRAGVPTLATDRGCICQILTGQSGATPTDSAMFEDFAFEWVRTRLESNHNSRVEERRGSLACFLSHRASALGSLSSLLTSIAGKT